MAAGRRERCRGQSPESFPAKAPAAEAVEGGRVQVSFVTTFREFRHLTVPRS